MRKQRSEFSIFNCTILALLSCLLLSEAKFELEYDIKIPALSLLDSKIPNCESLPNGLYPDLRTPIPCSRFFKCRNGKIVQSVTCQRGTFFSLRVMGGCGPRRLSACQLPSNDIPRPTRRHLATSNPSEDARNLIRLKKYVTQDPYLEVYDWKLTQSVCSWNLITCKKNKISEILFSYISFTSLDDILPIFAKINTLKSLYLSSANLKGAIPPVIGNLSQLHTLWLDGNSFQSPLPSEFKKLVNLKELTLSKSPLGSFPPVLFQMTGLTSLDLSETQLSGPVHEGIFSLTKLTTLSLAGNSLEGSLPSNICTFSSMQRLDLSSNKISGTIPDAIGQCSTDINLSGNQLSGSIPAASLCMKKSISALFLAENAFSGVLSDALADCPLTNLDLHGNRLEGGINPKLITKLSSTIQNLDLSDNPLGGTLPVEISDAKKLTFLGLSNTSLTGEIPKTIGKLPMLYMLYLDTNNLSGPIPPSFSQLSSLSDIKLYSNRLSGKLPEDWSGLQMLSWLDLHDNRFSGNLPASLLELTSVQNLWLQENDLVGSIPSAVGGLTSLISLNLSSNAFDGQIPLSLGNLISLTSVDLSRNRLSGEIPSALQKLKVSLTSLRLNDNEISGKFPTWLITFSNLTSLHLENNRMTGVIPLLSISPLVDLNLSNNSFNGTIPNFAYSDAIQTVDLSHNQFYGYIASWTYQMESLRELRLGNNLISGSLTPDIGSLSSLLVLDLNGNQISGNLPSQISNLTRLTVLNLKANKLQGQIPDGIGNLASLTFLDLSDNDFSEKLPATFSLLQSLQFFNVSGNEVKGSIPQTINRFNRSSFMETSLCGKPLKTCRSSDDVGLIVGIVVGCALTLSVLFFIVFLLFYMRRRYRGAEGEGELILFENFPCNVDYNGIIKTTRNFDDKYKLGSGGFGAVYIASFGNGQVELAVKRLMETSRRDEEFKAEIKTLGQIRHKNLVTLLGAYLNPASHETLLLYNYLKGGNLDMYLCGSKSGKEGVFSSWSVRHRIALGAARGFKYLHHECEPAIVHRDIKPANILIDENMEAYVADFGLAKVMDVDDTHMSTSVLGTIGYFAPEYTQRGHLYVKSDVFSFGIVLLQIITGKRPTNPEIAEAGGLALWVARNSPESVIDSNMVLEEDEMEEVLACLKLGLLCTAKKPSDRPSMANVVQVLENLSLFAEEIESSIANTPSSVASFPWGTRSEGMHAPNSDSLSGFEHYHQVVSP